MAIDRVQMIPQVEYSTADLTSSLQQLNPDGLPESCFELIVVNDSDNVIGISFDGVTMHESIADNSRLNISSIFPSIPQGNSGLFNKGLILWILSLTQDGGTLYLSGLYT